MRGSTVVLVAVLWFALVVGGVSCEYRLWKECRRDHSWLYCTRVLDTNK